MNLKAAQKRAAIILLSIFSVIYTFFFAVVNFPKSSGLIFGVVTMIAIGGIGFVLLVKVLMGEHTDD